jgi:1,4-dihydroxy-2-naphthoate octaprenyltransferase
LVYGAFPLIALLAMVGWTPMLTVFAFLLISFATGPVRIVYSKTDGPALIRALKMTARLHLWTGLVLAVAILA